MTEAQTAQATFITLAQNDIAIPPTTPPEINVGRAERKYSLIGGTLMSLLGLRRGGLKGIAMLGAGGMLLYRGATGHCPAFSRFHVNTAQNDGPASPQKYFAEGIHVEQSLTINCPADELYRVWRNFSNLPRFMRHLKSVEELDNNRSRWVANAPVGWSVQWDAEIINEELNSLIAWRSVGGVDVDNAGSVRFIPATDGASTEVRVVMDYIPPAGKLGFVMARVFGEDAEQQIHDDLRRFKQLVEAGEIVGVPNPAEPAFKLAL